MLDLVRATCLNSFSLTAYLTAKYLDIPIDNFDNNLFFSENFPSITRKVQTLLNIWSSRSLTLLGKITVLTLCLPWGQYDPNYIFEKLLLLSRWQQRYETL